MYEKLCGDELNVAIWRSLNVLRKDAPFHPEITTSTRRQLPQGRTVHDTQGGGLDMRGITLHSLRFADPSGFSPRDHP
ncbi:hypothetical protein NPIL_610431 [Nephila pilipes]|uniref:Uncharacterized protein n=1 Tax=Nephila pilipes TaxID=299642 RepID=A0A8X6T6G4_NEPPI|nr:hypothetical protein NPIL_610431 [Nephila pilipes]